jgi:hypothetical protein
MLKPSFFCPDTVFGENLIYVDAQDAASYFEGVEGCGLACESPLLTGDEHARLKTFIGIAGTVCLGRQPAFQLVLI